MFVGNLDNSPDHEYLQGLLLEAAGSEDGWPGLGLHESVQRPGRHPRNIPRHHPCEDWSKITAEQGGLGSSTVTASNGIVRPQLDGALAAGQGSITSWPFVGAQISDLTQVEAVWRVPFFFARPPDFLRVLQPGNAPFLLPSVSTAPKWNILSSHPPPLVYSALPANAPVTFSEHFDLARSSALERPCPECTHHRLGLPLDGFFCSL